MSSTLRASKLEQRIAEVKAELAEQRGEFRAALEAQTSVLLKWMLGIWVATIPAVASVVALVQHLLTPHP